MTRQPQTPPTAPSATSRRYKNGLMVALAVIAAVGTVVILNYVVYWQYRGLSPDTRSWVRFDLTSTRRYSLSQQSRAVLDDLDGQHRLVTLLGGEDLSGDRRQRIRDLADEYARASTKIDAYHIDLDTQADRRSSLLKEIDTMFADDTANTRAMIKDALALLESYTRTVDQIEAGLATLDAIEMGLNADYSHYLSEMKSPHRRLKQEAQDIRQLRDAQLGSQWAQRLESPSAWDEQGSTGGEPVPDYFGLLQRLQVYFNHYVIALPITKAYANLLANAMDLRLDGTFAQRARADQMRRMLLQLKDQTGKLERPAKNQIKPFNEIAPPQRYEEARVLLNEKACVLLTSGTDARVLPAHVLFRGAGDAAPDETSDLFVGEEQLTGAFISLSLDPPPLIVFVRSNTKQRAISAFNDDQQKLEGVYDHVVNRLVSMDFEIAEWADPEKQAPPKPRLGQRVVWITLPYHPPSLSDTDSRDHRRKDGVVEFLTDRIEQGDSVLVMLSPNPFVDPERKQAKHADSLVALLSSFGIQAQLYQTVSRLDDENEDAEKSRYSVDFLVRDWPDSVIAGQALDGIDTYFSAPMPLVLKPTDGVTQTRLVELNLPAMYVQRDTPEIGTGSFTPKPDSSAASVLIGAGAQRGESRIMTIGDRYWAMDNRTTAAVLPDGRSGIGLADQPGARVAYPGNTDLFVNCICWLAHEESLIAASPRTQDLRRIKAMEPGTLRAFRVLLWGGMPAVIFAAGIGVWVMRRRA